jgi:hypothetical protein
LVVFALDHGRANAACCMAGIVHCCVCIGAPGMQGWNRGMVIVASVRQSVNRSPKVVDVQCSLRDAPCVLFAQAGIVDRSNCLARKVCLDSGDACIDRTRISNQFTVYLDRAAVGVVYSCSWFALMAENVSSAGWVRASRGANMAIQSNGSAE